jgi:hypothetical protein
MTGENVMTEKDEERIAKLEAAVERLIKANAPPKPFKAEPWQPIDYTANATMDPATMLEFARATGNVEVVKGPQGPRSMLPPSAPSAAVPSAAEPAKKSTGWQDTKPLEPPPGQELIEQIADHFDRIDRAKGL